MAGIKRVGGKPIDGRNLVPLLMDGQRAAWPDRMIFSHQDGKVSARIPLLSGVAERQALKTAEAQHAALANAVREQLALRHHRAA